MTNRRLALAALLCCSGIAGTALAQADYPVRPITLIIPFPAGGVTDVVGREMARNLSKALNQPVVVDNRAGAGGNIGTQALARARPDGYTLGILTVSAMSIAPHITKNPGFVPSKDFTPITNVVNTPGAIIANVDTPFNTLGDLVRQAKAQPGKIGYASVGNGSIPHLTAEMFSQQASVNLLHVPYRGAAPALQDLLAGHIALSFETSLVSTVTNLAGGRIKVLAITGPNRSPALPTVPSVAESGYPGFSAQGWFGLFGPAGLPPKVTAALSKAATDALKDPEVIERLKKLGTEPAPGTPEEFTAFLKEEDKKWASVAKRLNLQLD